MNTLIEEYRGIDIIFNTDTERFSFDIDEGSWNEKQSFAACKKNIDDYLKANAVFKPFKIRYKQNGDSILLVVGIRKDNRFIVERNGKKEQFSEYSEKDYILFDEKDNIIYSQITELEKQRCDLQKEVSKLYDFIDTITLKELKPKYIHK